MVNTQNTSQDVCLALFVLMALQSGCQTMQPNTAAGGLFGTAAGGALGAAIGSQDGKTGEGALIGGLAGGTIGALLGNQADQANQRDEQNFYAQQRQAQSAAITMDQIVQMTRSGLSDELISSQIDLNGIVARPNSNDLILLQQSGVNERVIRAMQSARIAGQPVFTRPAPAIVMPPDIIYAEPVRLGPPVFFAPPPFGPVHHFGPPPCAGSHVGLSVGF